MISRVESRFQNLKSRYHIIILPRWNIIILLRFGYQLGMGVMKKVLGKA